MNVEYKAKITGDMSGLEKVLKAANGSMKQLTDKDFIIKLDYDGNVKALNKTLSDAVKACPELAIQFQYDVNKKALEQKLNDLNNIEALQMDIDTGKVQRRIREMISDIETGFESGIDTEDVLKTKIEALYKYANSAAKAGANVSVSFERFEDIDGSLGGLLTKLSKTPQYFGDMSKGINGALEQTKSDISEIQKQLDYFKSKGAVDTTAGFDKTEEEIDETSKKLKELVDGFEAYYKKKNGLNAGNYWKQLKQQIDDGDESLKELLSDLKLLDDGKLNLITAGAKNQGGIIGEERVAIARKNDNNQYEDTLALKRALDEAYDAGVNVARIMDVIGDESHETFVEIQERATGKMLGAYGVHTESGLPEVNPDFLEATDEQIQKLIKDIFTLQKLGINAEAHPENLIYDKLKGFQFIDLDLNPASYINSAEMIEDAAIRIAGDVEDMYDELGDTKGLQAAQNFGDKFRNIGAAMAEVYDAAEKTAEETQDSHFPSKVAEKLGEKWGVGYAEGIKKHKGDVEDAVRELVKAGELTMHDLVEDLPNIVGNAEYIDLESPVKNILSATNGQTSSKYNDAIKNLEDSIRRTRATLDTEDNGVISKMLFGPDGTIKSEEAMLAEIRQEAKETLVALSNDGSIEPSSEEYAKRMNDVFSKLSAAQSWSIVPRKDVFENSFEGNWISDLYETWKEISTHATENLSDDYMAMMGYVIEESRALNQIREMGEENYLALLEKEKTLSKELGQIKKDTVEAVDAKTLKTTDDEAQQELSALEKKKQAIDETIAGLKEYKALGGDAILSEYGGPEINADGEISQLEKLREQVEKNIDAYETYKIVQERAYRREQLGIFEDSYDKTQGNGTPSKISTAYERIWNDVERGALSGEEAIARFESKVKELGYTFDETSKNWTKIESAPALLTSEQAFVQYGESLDEVAKKSKYTKDQLEELYKSGRNQLEASSAVDVLAEAYESVSKASEKASSDIGDATDSIKKEGQAAEESARQKDKFTKANQEAAKSGKETAEGAKKAAEAVKEEANAFKENADLSKWLTDIQSGTNTIEFGVAIDKEMAEAELKRIAPALADEFNKQYGTNITGSQVVKAYKSALKERQAAEEAELQEHLGMMEERTQKDNEAFREQISNWQRYVQEGAAKRKEAEELAQQKRQDVADMYAAEDLEYLDKRNKYLEIGKQQEKEAAQIAKERADEYERIFYNSDGELNATIDTQALSASNALYDKISGKLEQIYALKEENLKIDKTTQVGQDAIAKNEADIAALEKDTVLIRRELSEAEAIQVSRENELLALHQKRNAVLSELQHNQELQSRDSMTAQVSKWTTQVESLQRSGKYTQEFTQELNEALAALKAFDSSSGSIEEVNAAFEKLDSTMKDISSNKGLSEFKRAQESSIAKLNLQIEEFMQKNSRMGSEFQQKFKNLKLDFDAETSLDEVQKLVAEFAKLKSEVTAAGKTGASFFDTLRQRVLGVNAQLIAQYLSWQDMIRYARQAIEVIKELDYALVDLKKTTTMTSGELKDFYYASNDTAKQMGVTTEQIINQAAAWSRLGYSSKETVTEMAALSSQFAQISPGMSVETATDGLVSVMKAFHVDVADVERNIMDVINKTGKYMPEHTVMYGAYKIA